MTATVVTTRRARRERRWNSKPLRGALVAAGFVLVTLWGLVVPSAAGACTDTEERNGMTCHTPPAVSKCVLGVGSAAAVGGVFGGPLGLIAGVIGAGASCAINAIG